jgi:monothiol glutaredoxin
MTTKEQINQDVKKNKVVLYMKGTPEFPQCGFSAQAANILKSYKVHFLARNVLEDDELREAVKEYSNWPTLPQLFINGEFIGGCDIMTEMHENGELKNLLEKVR